MRENNGEKNLNVLRKYISSSEKTKRRNQSCVRMVYQGISTINEQRNPEENGIQKELDNRNWGQISKYSLEVLDNKLNKEIVNMCCMS